MSTSNIPVDSIIDQIKVVDINKIDKKKEELEIKNCLFNNINSYNIEDIPLARFIKKIIRNNSSYISTLVKDVLVHNIKSYVEHLVEQLSTDPRLQITFVKSTNLFISYYKNNVKTKHPNDFDSTAFNGLIFNDVGEILCIPPRSMLRFNTLDNIKIDNNEYRAYIAIDGTVFSLYYNDKWCISTNKGYLMDEQTMFGKIPLKQLILNIYKSKANEHNIKLSDNNFIESLNKEYSYTFRLTSVDWNIGINSSFTDLVFIQATHNKNFNIVYDTSLFNTELASIINMTKTCSINYGKEIFLESRNYIKFRHSSFYKEHPYFSGIILRSNNKYHNDIFLESEKMELLRKYIYSQVNITTSVKHLALHHYLSVIKTTEIDKLITIYTPFSQYFEEFSIKMNTLINVIIQKISGKSDLNISVQYDMVSNFFIKNSIVGEISYLKDSNLYHNILDIIKNKQYETIYASLWCN
jgi:hypothetical protein